MRLFAGAALFILTLSMPTAGQAMSVADFLTKVQALKAKGMGAMFSPDLKIVMAEMKSVSADYRADLAKTQHGELGCPPPKGKAKINSDEFIAEFSAVPVAQRGTTSVKSVFYAMMKRRFPCR